jgi:hypothetical protein
MLVVVGDGLDPTIIHLRPGRVANPWYVGSGSDNGGHDTTAQ